MHAVHVFSAGEGPETMTISQSDVVRQPLPDLVGYEPKIKDGT